MSHQDTLKVALNLSSLPLLSMIAFTLCIAFTVMTLTLIMGNDRESIKKID